MFEGFVAAFITRFTAASTSLVLFETGFVVCFALKLLSELSRGYWNYFEDGTWLQYINLVTRTGWAAGLVRCAHKVTILLSAIACVSLAFGHLKVISLLIITCFLLLQNFSNFKYHTCFFILLSSELLISHVVKLVAPLLQVDWFISALIVTSTSCLYVFSALRKALSLEFRSGFSLGLTLKHLAREGCNRKYHFDNTLVTLARMLPSDRRFHAASSKLVVLLEIALPTLLLIPSLKTFGIVLGIAMHGSFTLIAPRTLTHFSLVTITTYLLF